tara:strand:+ start:218 stop:427 length:210 start_codon:yes stop_codon:yes gene_type:complete
LRGLDLKKEVFQAENKRFLNDPSHQKRPVRPIARRQVLVLGVDLAARMLHRTPTPFGGLALITCPEKKT